MANFTIGNARNTPLNVRTGTVPDVSDAMQDWYQPMVFTRVVKQNVGFQLVETATDIAFRGVIQPFGGRKLLIKPEAQRAWTWFTLHADPCLTLEVDEVVSYLGVQTRVMKQNDYRIYGYVEYELVQDWTGSGPGPSTDNVLTTESGDQLTTEGGDFIVAEGP